MRVIFIFPHGLTVCAVFDTRSLFLTERSLGSIGSGRIALREGALTFLRTLMKDHAGYACPVSLYTLSSVNILRKYSFVLDTVPTLIQGVLGGGRDKGDNVMFSNDAARYWKSREAMVAGHKSQMVWFRWGWIGVGRYMVVNDLKRERVAGS